MIPRTHKLRLDPNNKQSNYLAQCLGNPRVIYNWGIDQIKEMIANEEKIINCKELQKRFREIRDDKFPYMKNVSSRIQYKPLDNLYMAMARFRQKISEFPTYKKRGQQDSCYFPGERVAVDGEKIKIPMLGWVKMYEELRFDGKIVSVTISRRAGRWFASVLVDVPEDKLQLFPITKGVIGLDFGIHDTVVDSNGVKFNMPDQFKEFDKRIKFAHKSLSRKKKGSKNWIKQVKKLQVLYYKRDCIKMDFLHKLTTMYTKDYDIIVIENLNVSGMMKNKNLAKSVQEASFRTTRTMFEYKTKWNGKTLIVADRWFASSRLCCVCGTKNTELKLSDREWICPVCKTKHDRDINAAINLKQYGLQQILVGCEDSKTVEIGSPCVIEVNDTGASRGNSNLALL